MGGVINEKFARVKSRKNKGKNKRKRQLVRFLGIFITIIVFCLWWTGNFIYALLLFVGMAAAILIMMIVAVLWSERRSPDWDHQ